jgi:GH25 family lysozyme M1 (1,4-beta-N-acetylmuramidase)
VTETVVAPNGVEYVAFLDVSAWQFDYRNSVVQPGASPPDYRAAVRAGFAGVIHRIGNGRRVDASFPLGYGAARDAGLPMGAYYYAQPNLMSGAEAAAQCDRWLSPYELQLPLMLDFEDYDGPDLSAAAMYAWLAEFFAFTEAIQGRPGLLYAGATFATPSTVAGSLAHLDTVQPRYPRNYERPPIDLELWHGWIPWHRPPDANTVLGRWEAWQFSSSAYWRAYGGPSDCATDRVDVNIVPVDIWRRWDSSLAPTPPQPTPIPPVPTYRYVPTNGEDVTYQVRHSEAGWPGEAVFNVTASTIIHMQHGDAANVDAFVGLVPTISNTKVWVGGDEAEGYVRFTRAMLLQLLRDPARRHISLRHNGEVMVNDGNPFVDPPYNDNELAVAWATHQY